MQFRDKGKEKLWWWNERHPLATHMQLSNMKTLCTVRMALPQKESIWWLKKSNFETCSKLIS